MADKDDETDQVLAGMNQWLMDRAQTHAEDMLDFWKQDREEQIGRLALMTAALKAIATQNYPNADASLEDEPYELFASRLLAAIGLWHLQGGPGEVPL